MFRDFSVATVDQPGSPPLTLPLNGELLAIQTLLPLSEIDSLFADAGRESSIFDETDDAGAAANSRSGDEEFSDNTLPRLAPAITTRDVITTGTRTLHKRPIHREASHQAERDPSVADLA
jgi:hypothetical protein